MHLSKTLRQEAKGADYLVLWLDNDREGENICFEVIDCVLPVLKKSSQKIIYRAKVRRMHVISANSISFLQ